MSRRLGKIIEKLFDESESDNPDFKDVIAMVEALEECLDDIDDIDLVDQLEEYIASWSTLVNLEDDPGSWRDETAELIVTFGNEGYLE